jgi:hypothetical protein
VQELQGTRKQLQAHLEEGQLGGETTEQGQALLNIPFLVMMSKESRMVDKEFQT